MRFNGKMFVNNLENNAEKKTTLYLRFEKYHNLHFFKKEENPEIDCVSTRHLLPLQC